MAKASALRLSGAWPIIVQIVLLVAVAVALATAVLLAITFEGPPPRNAPVPLTEVAQILLGHDDRLPRGAHLVRVAAPPVAPNGMGPDQVARALLAAAT